MIVNDVLKAVQRTFGDEAGVQITPDDVIRWINEAQEEILVNNEGLNQASAFTNAVINQSDYPFPVDCSTISSLMYNSKHLKYMQWAEYSLKVVDYLSGTGTPEIYTVWDKTLTLYPIPNASITSGIKIYYIKYPVTVTLLTDTLEFPKQYDKAIIDYCLQQAYELDEDVEKSQLKASQFDRKVKLLNGREDGNDESYPTITVLPGDESFYGGY